MKNIKKITVLAMIVIMILSFAACGKDNSIVGKWTTTIDQSSQMTEEETAAMKALGIDMEILKMSMTFDFKEDGSLSIEMNSALTGKVTMDEKYIAKNGKFYSSQDKHSEINEKKYIEYTVEGNKLTFTQLISEDNNTEDLENSMGMVFPIIFEKVE